MVTEGTSWAASITIVSGPGQQASASATAAGRRTIKRVTRLRALGMERLLEPFDTDEREQFAEFLERFVTSIDRLVTELAQEQ